MQRLSKVVSHAPCATISYDLESELQALCTATTAAARIVWLRHPHGTSGFVIPTCGFVITSGFVIPAARSLAPTNWLRSAI
jgi:hypothetical protein